MWHEIMLTLADTLYWNYCQEIQVDLICMGYFTNPFKALDSYIFSNNS